MCAAGRFQLVFADRQSGMKSRIPRSRRSTHQGWNVRTADNTSAANTKQESVASCTVDSEKVHRMSECITTVAPGLESAPQAGHGTVQSKCSDCSRTDPLPGEWASRSGRTPHSGRKSSGGDKHIQHSG